jgi:hypothetical protein
MMAKARWHELPTTQVMQTAVVGLEPTKPYVLALASKPDGSGQLEVLAQFTTNPAGAHLVDAVGPIRSIVDPATATSAARRHLTITAEKGGQPGRAMQVQQPGATGSPH